MKLKSDYPIKTLCDLLELPRSSWYYSSIKRDEGDLKSSETRGVSLINCGASAANSRPSDASVDGECSAKWA